jgi:hypothetical protein
MATSFAIGSATARVAIRRHDTQQSAHLGWPLDTGYLLNGTCERLQLAS